MEQFLGQLCNEMQFWNEHREIGEKRGANVDGGKGNIKTDSWFSWDKCTRDGKDGGITGASYLIARSASVCSSVMCCYWIDDESTTALANTSCYDTSVKRRFVTMERPGEIKRCVAF